MGKKPQKEPKAGNFCGKERPPRKVICQLKKGHKGSHRAVVFWEDTEFKCSKCKTEIQEGQKFCHECGTEQLWALFG